MISPNPHRNILLFSQMAEKNSNDLIVCLYDYQNDKYMYKGKLHFETLNWSSNGDKLYVNSYRGLMEYDLRGSYVENISERYNLRKEEGFSYGSFAWSKNEDKLIYTIDKDLFMFDKNALTNKKLKTLKFIKSSPFDYQEYFTNVLFINNDQSILYLYQEGPEFPGQMAILDMKTYQVRDLYMAPELSIEKIINNKNMIISTYEMINEVDPQKYTLSLLNIENKKSVQLYKIYNTISTWDYNSVTNKLAYIKYNKLRIVDLKAYMKKIK